MKLTLLLAVCLCLVATMAEAQTRIACGDLSVVGLADTKVETFERITPDPRWDYPPSLFNARLGKDAYVGKGHDFCRVGGTIEGTIHFELWLPDNWNGKFQGVGNGGFTGAINYPAMGEALARGYAVASTDLGHKSKSMFDVSWIRGRSQALRNLMYRAQHLVALRSKELILRFYGRRPNYAYFNGCSSGGWQGLTEAQKFPDDYDAILAGAPAHDFVRLQANSLILAQLSAQHPEGNLSDQQMKAMNEAAIKQCDAKDGVKDGLIADPEHCGFDPASLQCKAGEKGDTCLSEAQVARARFLYGPRETKAGLRLYPGPAWGVVVAGKTAPRSLDDLALARGLDDLPQWTPQTFDPDRDIPALEAFYGYNMTAMNPDLSDFVSRGGKIIVYQGWNDPSISPFHAIQYRQMVADSMGAARMDEFYRLFMVPGMGHCRGGPGPDQFDALTALENWVEKGEAPDRITARHVENGKVTMSMPLCVYPKVAVYDGVGSSAAAENFTCKAPGASAGKGETLGD